MGRYLNFQVTGHNKEVVADLSDGSLLATIEEGELEQRGMLPYVEGSFALRNPGQPTQYYAASVVSALVRFNPGMSEEFSDGIPISDINITQLGFVPVQPGLAHERIAYLQEAGMLHVKNGKIGVDQFDMLLEDITAAAIGMPRVYEGIADDAEVPQCDYADLILFYSTRDIPLRQRSFLQTDRVKEILGKMEGEVPVSEFYSEAHGRRLQRTKERGEKMGISSAPKHDNKSLALRKTGGRPIKELREELQTMDDKEVMELELHRELSGDVFASYGEFIDVEEILELTRRLKYAVDTGLSAQQMKKGLKEAGLPMPDNTSAIPKLQYKQVYESIIRKMYTLDVSDVVDLAWDRAIRSRIGLNEEMIDDIVSECRPVEFDGRLYFKGTRVMETLDVVLPDIDEMRYIPLGDAFRLIREAEGLYHVKPVPWITRELLDMLPRFSLNGKASGGKFVAREDLNKGIVAMLKHRYHVPEVQRADTTTFLGGTYIVLDERYDPRKHHFLAVRLLQPE